MRPKSIATVVVSLRSTPEMSSTPTLLSVSISSVRSGRVSETVPTIVVLPTPKPPAMTILTAVGSLRARVPRRPPPALEGPETIDHRLVEPDVVHVRFGFGFLQRDETLVEQVAEQHPHGRDGKVEMAGDLGHGHHRLAQADAGQVLGTEPDRALRLRPDGDHQRDEVELAAGRLDAAAGHHVGADHRAGLVVEQLLLRRLGHERIV